jgi:hypothetical protein
MVYPKEEIDELKCYCVKLSFLSEAGVDFLHMEGLRLPIGCEPPVCDGLLCPVHKDGYPSRLYLSVQVTSPYTKNWNVSNLRIGERNWFAFSWRVEIANPTLAQLLVAHLTGFTKDK